MKAVTWRGVNEIGVEDVPEPQILNDHDIILEVGLSVTCGSDLHLLGGYIPAMRAGDVLGHEFMGTVAEVGPGVTKHQVGDRVVVVSFIGCGQCWYCRQGLWSLCDNGNPDPGITEAMWGQSFGGCFGYSHTMGGWAGSHAPYIRGALRRPGGLRDPRRRLRRAGPLRLRRRPPRVDRGAPGGGAGRRRRGGGGAGGVGQMAARAAMVMGAERVVVIDRRENRLEQVARTSGRRPSTTS